MEMTWLRHLAYAFMPAVTLLWGEALRARFLYRGARRAVRLLVAALLAWQSVRLLKYMLEPVPDAGDGLINAFWYLYYIFRAALPVALLWIAHVADRDAVARRMPPHLLALLLLNLVLAAAILTNDWHEQVFSFPQEREGGEWEEKLEWGAYAYWVIWFLEVFAALAILWVKAGLQKIWRLQMVLPVALCCLFLAYSIFYNFLPLVRIDVTFTTTGFFLLLLELCLQTGLMPSNDEHESFFREASPGLVLLDEKGRACLVSKAVPGGEAERKDYRISKMKVPGGGTLVWYENMHLLRERQRILAQANRALARRRRYLEREAPKRRERAAQMMQDRLREEVESLLKGLRPYFREFREEILKTEGEAQKHAVHKLNLLATYTKKRCVLFLKSEESGRIALEDLEMASSEICSALRAFHLHAAIDWKMSDEMTAQTALLAFDALTTFLAQPGGRGHLRDDGRGARDLPRRAAGRMAGALADALARRPCGEPNRCQGPRLCRVGRLQPDRGGETMSGYMAMLCLLPAFLAAITSAFGLRAAYVRSSRAVSVSSEAAAVLLSSDLLLACFKLREWAAGHEDAPFFLYVHIVLLAAATCLILLSLYQLRSDAVTKRGLLRASLLLVAVLLDFGAAGLPWGIALASLLLVLRAGLAWHHARPAVREWVREGLDTLPEGILFAHGDGRIVLANLCMLDFMEGTVGGHSRDAEAFWQKLREMAQQGGTARL